MLPGGDNGRWVLGPVRAAPEPARGDDTGGWDGAPIEDDAAIQRLGWLEWRGDAARGGVTGGRGIRGCGGWRRDVRAVGGACTVSCAPGTSIESSAPLRRQPPPAGCFFLTGPFSSKFVLFYVVFLTCIISNFYK